MISERSQEIVNRVIAARIAVLTGIICSADEEVAESAIMHLALIGTKGAADALMHLIEQMEDSKVKNSAISLLITFSPFREDYAQRLTAASGDAEGIRETYLETEQCDQRLIGPPMWQAIVEELDTEFAREPGSWYPKPINWPA